MKKLIIGALVFFGLVYLLLIFLVEEIEVNKYGNIEEVKSDKGIQRGWIPAILPSSSYDIVESHQIDKSSVVGKFRYKENDEESFMKNFVSSPQENAIYEWKEFLFQIDLKLNEVKFRSK